MAVVVDVEAVADVEPFHTPYTFDAGLNFPAGRPDRCAAERRTGASHVAASDSYRTAGVQSPSMDRRSRTRIAAGLGMLAALVGALAGPALAHGGSLGGAARGPLSVARSLVAGTGGMVVAVSVALAGLRGRGGIVGVFGPRRRLSLPLARALSVAASALGVVALAGVVVVGWVGPADPLSNAGVVLVWVGWWAGFAMSTYLVGNAWPAVNPWRTLARSLDAATRTYRWHWGAWPSVAALLALFWLATVAPLVDRPPVLAAVVLGYSVVTVGGAAVYGTDAWFDTVDPIARAFRCYGWVAPLGYEDGSLALRVPGAALAEDVLAGADDVAFVVTLLWGTVFDGLVTTPLWGGLTRAVVARGVPPMAWYPLALLAGFAACWGAYLLAVRVVAWVTDDRVGVPTLARRFAPALLAVAAGYHLAHVLDYFLSLVPALALAVAAPFATVDPPVLVPGNWIGAVVIASVLAGHAIATLVVRATALETFDDGDAARRCQYAFAVVMAGFSLLSLWVVTRPEVAPPFVGA